MRKTTMLDIIAIPIVETWISQGEHGTLGTELQRLILRGFANEFPVDEQEHTFEKIFTFKEHGEFFRAAMLMAGISYSFQFYELLRQYGTIKVVIKQYRTSE